MKRSLLWPIGAFLVLIGGVWTAQGIGWLHGSPMTDQTQWAIIGPIVILAGGVLVVLGTRRQD